MITLFAKTGCPYCAKVLTKLDEFGLSFEKRNIADDSVAEELVAIGGKRQVPYMIDGEVRMYESGDIIEYLEKTYGNGSVSDSSLATATDEQTRTQRVCVPKF